MIVGNGLMLPSYGCMLPGNGIILLGLQSIKIQIPHLKLRSVLSDKMILSKLIKFFPACWKVASGHSLVQPITSPMQRAALIAPVWFTA